MVETMFETHGSIHFQDGVGNEVVTLLLHSSAMIAILFDSGIELVHAYPLPIRKSVEHCPFINLWITSLQLLLHFTSTSIVGLI